MNNLIKDHVNNGKLSLLSELKKLDIKASAEAITNLFVKTTQDTLFLLEGTNSPVKEINDALEEQKNFLIKAIQFACKEITAIDIDTKKWYVVITYDNQYIAKGGIVREVFPVIAYNTSTDELTETEGKLVNPEDIIVIRLASQKEINSIHKMYPVLKMQEEKVEIIKIE